MSYCMEVFRAIEANDADSERTIRALFATGEDISEQHTDVGTPLMWASALGHAHLVTLLIELGLNIAERHHQTRMTALHIAAACGKTDCVKTLIDAGAKLEFRDNQGWTPLMFAVQEGFPEVVDVLMRAGADVNATDDMDRTVLMQAARCDRPDIAERLLNAGADPNATAFWGIVVTALITAATSGADDVIRRLVNAGADVDFLDLKEGYTALMMAAQQGHASTVRLLLELGASVGQQTEFCVTAMMMARRGGHSDIEAILAEAGAGEPDEVPAVWGETQRHRGHRDGVWNSLWPLCLCVFVSRVRQQGQPVAALSHRTPRHPVQCQDRTPIRDVV